MFNIKKIKFNLKRKNYKWIEEDNDYICTTLNEPYFHKLVIQYCRDNNIILKSIKITLEDTCIIKIKGDEIQVMNLVLYIIDNASEYIINLKY